MTSFSPCIVIYHVMLLLYLTTHHPSLCRYPTTNSSNLCSGAAGPWCCTSLLYPIKKFLTLIALKPLFKIITSALRRDTIRATKESYILKSYHTVLRTDMTNESIIETVRDAPTWCRCCMPLAAPCPSPLV